MKLINCDLGECLSPDPDSEIMPLIDMANIACGGHAGDETSMTKTVLLAKEYGVEVGAHPSYDDQPNFGRISQNLTSKQLLDLVSLQLNQFLSLCVQNGVRMSYVKPHGALYHDMMQNPSVLDVICDVLTHLDSSLSLVVQAGIYSKLFEKKSAETSVKFIYEAFADRAYDGTMLRPRHVDGALLNHPNEIVEQYHQLCQTNMMQVDTVCFHSDNPASIRALQLLKRF